MTLSQETSAIFIGNLEDDRLGHQHMKADRFGVVTPMDTRYVAISTVHCTVRGDIAPLEAAILILDAQMRVVDSYTTPVIPSDHYELDMVSMNMPTVQANQLELEGLWIALQAVASRPEAADRAMADKVTRHAHQGDHTVIVLCDKVEPTKAVTARVFPVLWSQLSRRDAVWLEVEPFKDFIETHGIYGATAWKMRAEPRVHAVARYAAQVLRTLGVGARALSEPPVG